MFDKTERAFFAGTDVGAVVNRLHHALHASKLPLEQTGPATWSGKTYETSWSIAARVAMTASPTPQGFMLEVRITAPLDSIQYVFVQSGTRIHKTVHYFLMEPIGGDLAQHDHEFDEVRWIPFSEARTILTFETERALVAHAADVLAADEAGRAAEAAS